MPRFVFPFSVYHFFTFVSLLLWLLKALPLFPSLEWSLYSSCPDCPSKGHKNRNFLSIILSRSHPVFHWFIQKTYGAYDRSCHTCPCLASTEMPTHDSWPLLFNCPRWSCWKLPVPTNTVDFSLHLSVSFCICICVYEYMCIWVYMYMYCVHEYVRVCTNLYNKQLVFSLP